MFNLSTYIMFMLKCFNFTIYLSTLMINENNNEKAWYKRQMHNKY